MEFVDFNEYKEHTQHERVEYLTSGEFKRKTFECGNPGGVAAFSLVYRDSLEVTIFIDRDRFSAQSETSGETYEDVLPFVLEHEIRETHSMITRYSQGDLSGAEGHFDNPNHNEAQIEAMRSALAAGKLDKYLAFIEMILHVADEQTAEFHSIPNPRMAMQRIGLQRMLADKVRAENRVAFDPEQQ